ncbi:hypothetical protein TTHERM_00518530 (macronuclear) [Tetrahymena thermophila SB210]|uniref:Uncharacterized protein n=1 Tax=Tetrahymena thermophila (strain SB210) TaxID=312017 RepID=I7MIW0_TETTS|nr:hypothetical protein TTHERM_00518530 [Tetrahymena thermophila SB210]EAR95021.3 hypothetical protein TTHERM_00518530 [Tetrahymena thermophila SB210]|eukprot:XP_001015266.3 hypothetical protein TTHERM_00518530 [Tetrahymena thermophila SB210]
MSSKAFEILDNLGCPRIVCGHPTQQVIATESGCSLLFCDLANDKKIKMHRHENNISDILISEKYLFSVDQGPKVSVLISDINTLKRIYQFYLPPHKLRGDKPTHSVLLAYSDKFQRIVLLENEYAGGYRITGWEFKQEKLVKLFFVADIETTYRCLSLQILENASDLIVVTAEQCMIKYWKIESKQAILTNRIHIKEEIGQVLSDNNYRIILALTKTGKIILLNSQGDYLDTIKGEKPFSCMAAFSTFCFFGTIFGSIQIFDLKKNQKINEIPYLQEIKDSLCLEKELDEVVEREDGLEANYNSFSGKSSSFNQSQISNVIEPITKKSSKSYLKLLQQGPPVIILRILNQGNMINITYADGLQLTYDVSSNKVISQQIGHYEKINQIEWDLESQSRFFSVGSEGYFAAWNLYQDRWVGKILDIHKTFDKEQQTLCSLSRKNHFIQLTGSQDSILSSQPKQTNNIFNKEPQQKIKLTSIVTNYSYKEIYIGDSKGYITTLDYETLQPTKKHKVCNFKIKKMKLCPQSSYLAVVLSTGMSILLDILNQFQLVLKIEDHIHSISPTNQKGYFRDIHCILDSSVTSNEEKIRQVTRLSNQVKISQNISQTLQQQQIQKMKQSSMNNSMIQDSLKKIKLQSSQTKFNAGSYFNQLNEQGGLKSNNWQSQGKSSYKKEDPNQFLVIATNTHNQMRLHSVQINVLDDSVTGMALMIYQTEGRITGCDIHPSREYILILDDIGFAYLYKIRSGELRGRIEVPQFSSNVSIDPSGLYFAINSYQQYPEYYISDTEEDNEENAEDGQDYQEEEAAAAENGPRNQNGQQTFKKAKEENFQVKKGSKNGSQALDKIQKSYMMREFGKIKDPHAIQKEVQRDINLYEQNAQSQLQIPNGNHQSQEIKPVKYFDAIESFLHSSKYVIKPKMVLLYELGTGKQAGFIQNLFNASTIKFSHNSEYLAVSSSFGALSLWGLNDDIAQNIQGVFQQMESSPTFWSNFPIYIQKNLVDVRQIKQNVKNIINLENLQAKRQRDQVSSQQNLRMLRNSLSNSISTNGQQNFRQENNHQRAVSQMNQRYSRKLKLHNQMQIDDINAQQSQLQKENSIDNLSPIHKTIKESSEQNQYIRSQNFERAYQKLTPKSNQLQQHSNKNEIQNSSKNNFFQFSNLIQPNKIDQNFIKRQINEQPMKIHPGIKVHPNISLQNIGIQSPNQKRQILQRQVFDNPPDIDDDVIPIQNPLIYNKNYTSSKNLIQGVSSKLLQQQMKTAYEQSSKSSSRPLTPLQENPMDQIAQFEFKLAKNKTNY